MLAGKAVSSMQSQPESDHVDCNHSSQSQDCPSSGEHQFYHSVSQMPAVEQMSSVILLGFHVASPSPFLLTSMLCSLFGIPSPPLYLESV